MHILGLSAFYHDSAACLVQDGEILAAAQEERFSRIKHDSGFPERAIEYCLQEAGIEIEQLDWIVYYEKPLLKFDRLLESWLAVAPRGYELYRLGLPAWLRHKLRLPRHFDEAFDQRYAGNYLFLRHHESHAASAFFPSPFEEAAILTLDGVGEWTTGSIGIGRGNRLELLQELRFPHSLGLLYSAFTQFCGFKVNSGEYKLMGLAPYGEPNYRERILSEMVDLRADGSFRLNMHYFDYLTRASMCSKSMATMFGAPARKPSDPLTQREMDLAASIQSVAEEIVLRMARHAHARTGAKNLVLAGGVALNCVANGRLLQEGPFEQLWIQPAAGDAGSALGAALFVWHQLLDNPRQPSSQEASDSQQGSRLGPAYSSQSVRSFLDAHSACYHPYSDRDALAARVAELLDQQKVVGLFEGRMEFGPRALGGRSILGDARSNEMQSTLNQKIKFRESFRPFAPAVLAERAHEYFELPSERLSPYMLLVTRVQEAQRLAVGTVAQGLAKLGQRRSKIPAVTHVNDSARIQTVDATRAPEFARILRNFELRTGCAVLVNTSMNVRGEPIVCTPEEAHHCFVRTNMDALVLEDCLLLKDEQDGDHEAQAPEPLPEAKTRRERLLEIDWNPNARKLRYFGIILGAIVAVLSWQPVFWVAGGTLILLGAFWPRSLFWLYRSWMLAVSPFAFVFSHVFLWLSYFLLLTPFGFVRRHLGRDPLERVWDDECDSYWQDLESAPPLERYLRQY